MTEQTNKQSVEQVVANPDYITWTCPPYCELCNVYFKAEVVSENHFNGKNHKNRLNTWQNHRKSQLEGTSSKAILCYVCWKEMNTEKIFEDHCKSPAHAKEMKGRLIVQKLKEEYTQLKAKQTN